MKYFILTILVGLSFLISNQKLPVCIAQQKTPELIQQADKLLNQNKFDEALIEIDSVLSKDPKNPHALLGKALISYYKANHKDALTYFDQVIEIDKQNKYPYYLKGIVLFELSDYPKALETVNKSLEIDSSYVTALILKCNILRESGNHTEADKCLQEVVKYKPPKKK